MARISGNVNDSCKIIILSEDFLNVERVIDVDNDYSIYGLNPSTNKTIIVRRPDGKSFSYKNVEAVAHDIEISTPTLSVPGWPYTVYDNPTITSSTFNLISGNDTHYSTDWQIFDEGGLIHWESLNDTTNKTSITLPSNTLKYQRDYTFRCRYHCKYEGSSDWSEEIQASTLVYLSNHSFENWTESPGEEELDDWLFYDHNTYSGYVVKSSYFKTDGSFSAELHRNGDNCCIYRVISGEKGIDYWRGKTITFRCYGGSVSSNSARIRLYFGNPEDSVYSSYAGGGGGLAFSLLSITTTVPIDATQVQISCWLENNDTDIACFDEAEVIDHSVFTPFNESLRLYSFGNNNNGQLGRGTITNTSTPTVVGTYEFKNIQKGDAHIIGIKHDKTLWSCGKNDYGQLCQNDVVNRSTLTQIGTDADWVDISCGFSHTLALKTNGTLWACGANGSGQLGLSHKNNVSILTKVGISSDWNRIYSSNYHNFCIKDDGRLFGFGVNTNGQLGNNSRLGRSSPIQVGTLTDWLQLSCGSEHTVAVKKDGTLWAWGYNLNGQLGLGNRTPTSTPTKIGTDVEWISAVCSDHSTLALKRSGTLWSCGLNSVGQLGLNIWGVSAQRSTMTVVGTATSWKTISGSSLSFVALMFDGTVWGVGSNSNGQLGLGNTANRSTMTKIGSNTKWKKIMGFSGGVGTSTYLLESET